MTSALDNLSGPGKPLNPEPPNQDEIRGLVHSGLARLQDAEQPVISLEGRFDLAYNAAHALSLTALRWHGYRPASRYIVFQVLAHTLNMGPEIWRVLAKCHDLRNRSEYEGSLSLDERLVTDLISACRKVAAATGALTESGGE